MQIRVKLAALLAAALVCSVVGTLSAAEVQLTKDNTKVGFVGTKPEGKHEGGFNTVSGTIAYNPTDLTKTQLNVSIDTGSLWSDDAKLTAHLKSPDFFDVRRHPSATFASKSVEATKEPGTYTISGDLTLLGVKKPISFPAKLNVKDGQLTLSSYFTIDRTDFGMEYGAGKIDNKVSVTTTVKPAE